MRENLVAAAVAIGAGAPCLRAAGEVHPTGRLNDLLQDRGLPTFRGGGQSGNRNGIAIPVVERLGAVGRLSDVLLARQISVKHIEIESQQAALVFVEESV